LKLKVLTENTLGHVVQSLVKCWDKFTTFKDGCFEIEKKINREWFGTCGQVMNQVMG
jgi:hypothetical protein